MKTEILTSCVCRQWQCPLFK